MHKMRKYAVKCVLMHIFQINATLMRKYPKFIGSHIMTLDEEILKLLATHELTNQAELLRLLGKTEHVVTQSTLSRHLKRLGIQKVAGCYKPIEASTTERPGYTLVEAEPNLLVIGTRPGYAQPLSVILDENRPEHVAGTLAGDDTVLVVVTAPTHLSEVAEAVKALLSNHLDR